MRKPWRPDLYVVARFLGKLEAEPEWSKGKLQPAVRLNYDLFIRYLDALEERGLLERRGEGRSERIALTGAGREAGTKMRAWIASVFDQPP